MKYRKRHEQIEDLATAVLTETDAYLPNMDVEQVAKKRGLAVLPHDFPDAVSGALIIKNGKATIGFNATHHPVRQRFTIAHELGHYELKHERGGLFVDEHQKQFSLFYRDENSSTGEQLQEREANAFAAALLMPKELLIQEMKGHEFDLTADDPENSPLIKLAQKFGVSLQAMTYRIDNLNLVVYLM